MDILVPFVSNDVKATYDFVICSAGVVCPRCLLHDMPSHCFEVHQVVACCERGHASDALLAVGLLRIESLFFLLNGSHVYLTQVL
jgi:hypothetical protein